MGETSGVQLEVYLYTGGNGSPQEVVPRERKVPFQHLLLGRLAPFARCRIEVDGCLLPKHRINDS